MSLKKGIIFDLDGTLWDSTEMITVAWQEVVSKHGLNRDLSVDEVKSCMGLSMDEIFKKLLPNVSDDVRKDIQTDCQNYENEYLSKNCGRLYPKIGETLAALKERGYHLYIVTNSQDGYVEAFLKSSGFDDMFDDYEMYGRTLLKKDENIRLVVERNKIDSALYVGDTYWDYKAATAAGIDFVHAAYGFDNSDFTDKKIKSFSDLLYVV